MSYLTRHNSAAPSFSTMPCESRQLRWRIFWLTDWHSRFRTPKEC